MLQVRQLWEHERLRVVTTINAEGAENAESFDRGRASARPFPQKTALSQAEFVKALADSFAYCDPVVSSLTDESAVQLVKQGQNEVARGSVLTNLIAHDNEEYGIITIYLRLKSQVPPSTERQMQGRGGRGGRGGQ